MREEFTKMGHEQAGAPYTLGVVATFAPAKSTGEIPKTAGDIDNIAKALSDALQRAGCTPDDCHLEKLKAEKWKWNADGVYWVVQWETTEGGEDANG